MFDITFANGKSFIVSDDKTVHDLSRMVIENGKIVHMERVRPPAAFDLSRVAFDVVN